MFILLSGHEGTPLREVADLLKAHWAALGTTVYLCDAMAPAKLMSDSLFAVSSQFDIRRDYAGRDRFIYDSIVDWGRLQSKTYWGESAKKRAQDVCGRWDDLGLFYVAVVEGLGFREDFGVFSRAYRVYLKDEEHFESRMPLHPREAEAFGLAIDQEHSGQGVFDDIVNVETDTTEEIAKRIVRGFTERLESGFR